MAETSSSPSEKESKDEKALASVETSQEGVPVRGKASSFCCIELIHEQADEQRLKETAEVASSSTQEEMKDDTTPSSAEIIEAEPRAIVRRSETLSLLSLDELHHLNLSLSYRIFFVPRLESTSPCSQII